MTSSYFSSSFQKKGSFAQVVAEVLVSEPRVLRVSWLFGEGEKCGFLRMQQRERNETRYESDSVKAEIMRNVCHSSARFGCLVLKKCSN